MSDNILKPATHGHTSHGLGDAARGHAHPGNIARDGAPKRVHSVKVHGGMATASRTGVFASGGDHASALDSLSGKTVVPGRVTTQPGYGNSGLQSGHPLAKPPASKRLSPVRPAFGAKGLGIVGVGKHDLHDLGQAVLAEAFDASGSDDRQAHGHIKRSK